MKRTTGDLLILGIGITVCTVVVLIVVFLGLSKLTHPEQDVSVAASLIFNLLNVLVGAVAGFLAGRTGCREREHQDE